MREQLKWHDEKTKFFLRRAGHKKIRLPGLPWSPEFMAAREAALKGQWDRPETGIKRSVAGTVNAAIVSYYQSSAFRDGLAKSSRCTSHGLRAAAATRAADRGATTTQLKAWFGWKRDSEAERYTRHADRKRAAATLGKLMMETNKPATEIGSAPDPVSQFDV